MQKAIWMLAGGPMQHILAQKILEQGFFLIISDGNLNAQCKPLANLFLNIDTFDVESHLKFSDEISALYDIKAVMTFAADCHYTVAKLAEHLRLPHLNPDISLICRDKIKTRQLLRSHGLHQPMSFIAASYDEAISIIENNFSQSFVIKATDNSGSRGFQLIKEKRALTLEKFQYSLKHGTTGSVILEEYLEADPHQISEASVETIWFDGKMYWLNWVDRIFPRDLKFFPELVSYIPSSDGIEMGHVNPAKRSFSMKQEVENMIEKAGNALGMHQEKHAHILKADIFFSTKGPVILELTPRSSGGWDSSGSSPKRGANIAGGLLELAIGSPLTIDLWFRFFHYRDAERNVVVLSKSHEDSLDCAGRKFTLISGYDAVSDLLKMALRQLEAEQYVSIC